EGGGGGAFVFLPPSVSWRPVAAADWSANAPGIAAAVDGRADTAWAGPPGPSWIQALWPRPVMVARVEIEVGSAEQWPQPLAVLGAADGPWRQLPAEGLRPTRPTRQRVGAPHGQVWALVPP